MNKQEQLDVLSLLLRLAQINREEPPEHFLWETRIMQCDVRRLREYITDPMLRSYPELIEYGIWDNG